MKKYLLFSFLFFVIGFVSNKWFTESETKLNDYAIAIVNEDQAQMVNDEKVRYSDALIQKIIDNKDYDDVRFENAYKASADSRLAAQSVDAIITIPSDFTLSVSSINSKLPKQTDLVYELGSHVEGEDRVYLSNVINDVYTSFKSDLTYMYVYEMFSEVHQGQALTDEVSKEAEKTIGNIEKIQDIADAPVKDYKVADIPDVQELDISNEKSNFTSLGQEYFLELESNFGVYEEQNAKHLSELELASNDVKENNDKLSTINEEIKTTNEFVSNDLMENEIGKTSEFDDDTFIEWYETAFKEYESIERFDSTVFGEKGVYEFILNLNEEVEVMNDLYSFINVTDMLNARVAYYDSLSNVELNCTIESEQCDNAVLDLDKKYEVYNETLAVFNEDQQIYSDIKSSSEVAGDGIEEIEIEKVVCDTTENGVTCIEEYKNVGETNVTFNYNSQVDLYNDIDFKDVVLSNNSSCELQESGEDRLKEYYINDCIVKNGESVTLEYAIDYDLKPGQIINSENLLIKRSYEIGNNSSTDQFEINEYEEEAYDETDLDTQCDIASQYAFCSIYIELNGNKDELVTVSSNSSASGFVFDISKLQIDTLKDKVEYTQEGYLLSDGNKDDKIEVDFYVPLNVENDDISGVLNFKTRYEESQENFDIVKNEKYLDLGESTYDVRNSEFSQVVKIDGFDLLKDEKIVIDNPNNIIMRSDFSVVEENLIDVYYEQEKIIILARRDLQDGTNLTIKIKDNYGYDEKSNISVVSVYDVYDELITDNYMLFNPLNSSLVKVQEEEIFDYNGDYVFEEDEIIIYNSTLKNHSTATIKGVYIKFPGFTYTLDAFDIEGVSSNDINIELLQIKNDFKFIQADYIFYKGKEFEVLINQNSLTLEMLQMQSLNYKDNNLNYYLIEERSDYLQKPKLSLPSTNVLRFEFEIVNRNNFAKQSFSIENDYVDYEAFITDGDSYYKQSEGEIELNNGASAVIIMDVRMDDYEGESIEDYEIVLDTLYEIDKIGNYYSSFSVSEPELTMEYRADLEDYDSSYNVKISNQSNYVQNGLFLSQTSNCSLEESFSVAGSSSVVHSVNFDEKAYLCQKYFDTNIPITSVSFDRETISSILSSIDSKERSEMSHEYKTLIDASTLNISNSKTLLDTYEDSDYYDITSDISISGFAPTINTCEFNCPTIDENDLAFSLFQINSVYNIAANKEYKIDSAVDVSSKLIDPENSSIDYYNDKVYSINAIYEGGECIKEGCLVSDGINKITDNGNKILDDLFNKLGVASELQSPEIDSTNYDTNMSTNNAAIDEKLLNSQESSSKVLETYDKNQSVLEDHISSVLSMETYQKEVESSMGKQLKINEQINKNMTSISNLMPNSKVNGIENIGLYNFIVDPVSKRDKSIPSKEQALYFDFRIKLLLLAFLIVLIIVMSSIVFEFTSDEEYEEYDGY